MYNALYNREGPAIPESIELALWLFFAGVCYRLREYGGIWSKKNMPSFMRSPWWLNETPKLPCYTFQLWKDSYHFFGNLARISISIRVSFIDIVMGMSLFAAWFLGEYLTLQFIKYKE